MLIMIKIFVFFTSLLLLSCAQKSSIVSPMLWKITAKNLTKPSYIFGTYHTRDSELNRLPKTVYASLDNTQRFYSETVMDKKSTLKVASFSKLAYPIPLKQRLYPKTYKKLIKHLIKHKIPLSYKDLAHYKTWGIALMLGNDDTAKKDSLFMDEYLALYAKKNHVKQAGLESVLDQLEYFDKLPKSLQEQLLLDTLARKENKTYALALESWYVQGKSEGFMDLQKRFASKDSKQQKLDKVLFDGLLLERNVKFSRRIDILLSKQSEHSYFFAIGAGHLSGKKGVLYQLSQKGYTLTKIY